MDAAKRLLGESAQILLFVFVNDEYAAARTQQFVRSHQAREPATGNYDVGLVLPARGVSGLYLPGRIHKQMARVAEDGNFNQGLSAQAF
jgi:hypothetical protein